MSERDAEVLFGDMLRALDEIEDFAATGEAFFLSDLKTQRAVERSFEILGEAAAQMPPQVRASYPDLPWRILIDHRNRLIHGYASIDAHRVWLTIVQDLPALRSALVAVRQAPTDSTAKHDTT